MIEIVLFERGVGHFERKFRGEEGGWFINDSWRQKTIESLCYISRGVVCVILRLAVFRERTTLRSLYAIGRPSVVCLSSVCDVGAPYSGG